MGDTALGGDGGAGDKTALAGDGGTKSAEGMPAYVGQFSDDLKKLEIWKEHSTISDVGRALVKSKADSKGMVKIPDATTGEEELKAFRKANGVPDKAEEYKIDAPTLPDGMTMDPDTVKWFKGIAHKLGLNQHQANTLFAEESQRRVDTHNTTKGSIDKGIEGVKQKWGVDYDANLTIANRAVTKFGETGFPEFLAKTGLGNNPQMLEFCLAIGKAITEDKISVGAGPGGSDVKERRYPNSPEMYKD